MSHDAFISFSSRDRPAAEKIVRGLEMRGIRCWISSRNVTIGGDFQVSILKALEEAKVFVLVFSENANKSEEMRKELVLACSYKLAVLPVRIEKVEPAGAYKFQFAVLQFLDLFDNWDKNFAKLAEQIARITGHPLRPLPGSETTPNAGAQPTRVELAYWDSVKNSNDPVELEAYLRRYPEGRFASLAKRRAHNLRESKGNSATKPGGSNVRTGTVTPIPFTPPVERRSRKWLNIAIVACVVLLFLYVLAQKMSKQDSSSVTTDHSAEPQQHVAQTPVAPVSTAPPAQPAAINIPRCTTPQACIAQMMQYVNTDQPEVLAATMVTLARFAPPASADADRTTARAMNQEGLQLLHDGDTPRAVTAFETAAKSDPHDVEVVANLGYALLQARDFEKAESVFEFALELDPKRTNTWAPYADVLAQLNRSNDAVQALLLAYIFSGNQQHTVDVFVKKANDSTDPVLQQAYVGACRHVCPQ